MSFIPKVMAPMALGLGLSGPALAASAKGGETVELANDQTSTYQTAGADQDINRIGGGTRPVRQAPVQQSITDIDKKEFTTNLGRAMGGLTLIAVLFSGVAVLLTRPKDSEGDQTQQSAKKIVGSERSVD